jgi:MoxR-like ATPase
MIELLIAGILVDGHILIEGVPGVAKTLTAKLLSRSIDVGFPVYNLRPTCGDVIGSSFLIREMLFQFRPVPYSVIWFDRRKSTAPSKDERPCLK